jgi:hypothetical protein
MKRFPIRPHGRLLFAVPSLLFAASCVPHHVGESRARVSQDVPPPDSRTLLRRLALAVPDGVADQALSAQPALAGRHVTAAPPFATTAQAEDDATRALDCLTAAVYYEARSESPDGQRAVAQVVLNRVRDRAFPGSVCGVVFQGSTRRTGCQFSFTCDGSMTRRRDDGAWARAQAIASAALSGAVYAPVGSATYYHASSVQPWWASSLARIGSIGAHIFYRWRDGMERALAFRQAYAGSEPSVAAGGGSGVEVAGVTVHHGNEESIGGVTVHRGSGAGPVSGTVSGTVAAAAEPAVVAAAAPAPRTMLVSGVRIHAGGRMPGTGGSAAAGGSVADDDGPI